jgi:hypothetical protein
VPRCTDARSGADGQPREGAERTAHLIVPVRVRVGQVRVDGIDADKPGTETVHRIFKERSVVGQSERTTTILVVGRADDRHDVKAIEINTGRFGARANRVGDRILG